MNSPRELRRRIKSVRSMAQITRAMQMVAASKMRAAQQAAVAPRPFVLLMYRIQRTADDASRSTSRTRCWSSARCGGERSSSWPPTRACAAR